MIDNASKLLEQAALLAEEQVHELLCGVDGPVLGTSIVDLGLVYGILMDEEFRRVLVDTTLTTPACPLGPGIRTAAHAAITTRSLSHSDRHQPGVEPALGSRHDGL